MIGSYDAHALALFLAEHLRAHFSGNSREGSVQIVEDEKAYRLRFAPCGSGGAMRVLQQKNPGGAGLCFPQASPTTWGLKGTVPTYCGHCAQNELQSFKVFGTLKWVTEFDSDPLKPCGWTVYKNPEDIPEKFFTRLGLAKPAR